MKALIATFIFLASTTVFGATIELGKYRAVDKKTGREKIADFNLKADGRADLTIRASGLVTNCTGKYTVKENIFAADVKCNSLLLPETSVEIDISNVTPEGLRKAPGVQVSVMLDIFDAPEDFYLMKNDPKP